MLSDIKKMQDKSGMQINKSGSGIQTKIKKGTYFIIGSIALIAGFIGVFLPVLPTTPLILLAGWCYLRSSEKLYDWLINNERFGKTIKDFNSGKGITKPTKFRAISLMWIAITVSAVYFIDIVYVKGLMFMIAILVTIYLIKLPTTE